MTEKKIVRWMVPLQGHQFDLEDMPKWLDGGEVTVVKHDEGYVLAIPVEVIGEDHGPVLTFAEEKVSLINGVGRLLGSKRFIPITTDGSFYGIDSTGAKASTVVSIQGAEIRMRLGMVGVLTGGPVGPDPNIGSAIPLLNAASAFPQAYDALTILGRKDLTWPELYMLFELVQSDVGGEMFTLGWISEPDADLFCHTANSYSTLRSAGRHGKDRGAPPKNPMERSAAIALMRALVLAWLRSKA